MASDLLSNADSAAAAAPRGESQGGNESTLEALIARINGLASGSAEPHAPSSGSNQPPAGSPQPPRALQSAPAAPQASGHPPALSPPPAAAPAAATRPSEIGRSPAPQPPRRAVAPPSPSLAAAADFVASRDEPWRPAEPPSLHEVGVSESIIEQIILRFLLAQPESEGRCVAQQLQLPFRLVEPILTRLKSDQVVAYRSATATGDYAYVLTDSGRGLARSANADGTYYGACPVPLRDYIASVRAQSVEGQHPTRQDLQQAFSDLLINPRMLERLGPAVNSGRGMFLYGYPGNGKTSVAERVTAAFGKYIWIPRSVDVDGDILRVFDPLNHEVAMPESAGGLLDADGFDKRWVRIRRPTIVAGGELTMDMLEVQCSPNTKISEAPLQLKSNCGTLVIDDFGRQKMSVDQLLNRWIVPLEKRYDYLNMSSGKKIQVPFDQLVVFSTNLEPKDLVDDAFLRRIPYKIEVVDPAEDDFRKLFEIMCRVLKIPYRAEPIDYLVKTHYLATRRPFRNCQPRDLLLQVRNYCLYNDLAVELKDEYFDFAVENYFSVM